MNRSKWHEFEAKAIARAGSADPWVAYEHPLKNARSAQSTASLMRKVLTGLDIKTRKGVIMARCRVEGAA